MNGEPERPEAGDPERPEAGDPERPEAGDPERPGAGDPRPEDAAPNRPAADKRTGAEEGEAPPAGRPPPDDRTLLAECRVETFRAGGPGGQHQNRTESGVRLTHLPTGITATARESRSQHRNRKVALTRLRAALEELSRPAKPRIPTRVPGRAKRRRLEEKKRRSEVKRRRRRPDPEE